jgi:hypothetical protein
VIRCSRPCSQRPGKWLWVRRPPCCAGSDLELSGWVPLKAPPLSSRGMNPGATPTSSLSRFDQAEFCRGHPFWAVETNDLSLVRGLGLNDFLHWVKPRCGLPSNRERGTPSPPRPETERALPPAHRGFTSGPKGIRQPKSLKKTTPATRRRTEVPAIAAPGGRRGAGTARSCPSPAPRRAPSSPPVEMGEFQSAPPCAGLGWGRAVPATGFNP